MKSLIIYVVMTALIAIGERLYAQETDDHRAIRAVIDREQNANDSGDPRLYSTYIPRISSRSGLDITMEQRIGSKPSRDTHTMILKRVSRQRIGLVVQRYWPTKLWTMSINGKLCTSLLMEMMQWPSLRWNMPEMTLPLV